MLRVVAAEPSEPQGFSKIACSLWQMQVPTTVFLPSHIFRMAKRLIHISTIGQQQRWREIPWQHEDEPELMPSPIQGMDAIVEE